MRMSSTYLRLGILVAGTAIFVLLMFADRKALVNAEKTESSEADPSVQFFPSSLLAIQPELASDARKLASTLDSAQRRMVWLEIQDKSVDSLIALWCRGNAALFSSDVQEMVAVSEQLISSRSVADSTLRTRFFDLEFALRNKAIQAGENSIAFRVERALLLVNTPGRSMDGVLELRTLADENPENLKVQLILGNFSLQTGQWAKAEARFKTCLELEADHPEALVGMAEVLVGLDKLNEAKAYAQKALRQEARLDAEKVKNLKRLLNA
jgi:tetratricopeptide (TPR) repeat protein